MPPRLNGAAKGLRVGRNRIGAHIAAHRPTIDELSNTPVCDASLKSGVEIDYAGRKWACTTRHVILVQGFESPNQVTEKEKDMLDRSRGLQPAPRFSCQAVVGTAELVADIPKYSINHNKENDRTFRKSFLNF